MHYFLQYVQSIRLCKIKSGYIYNLFKINANGCVNALCFNFALNINSILVSRLSLIALFP